MTQHVTVTLLEVDIVPLMELLSLEKQTTLSTHRAARLRRIIRARLDAAGDAVRVIDEEVV